MLHVTSGHAPGHIRNEFETLAEDRSAWPSPEMRRLIGRLWNCTDIMPSMLCADDAEASRSRFSAGRASRIYLCTGCPVASPAPSRAAEPRTGRLSVSGFPVGQGSGRVQARPGRRPWGCGTPAPELAREPRKPRERAHERHEHVRELMAPVLPDPHTAIVSLHSCSASTSEPAEGRRYAVREALEQRDLQLLHDPQGPLDAGHGVQLRDQLVPARVATRAGEEIRRRQNPGANPNTTSTRSRLGQDTTVSRSSAISREPPDQAGEPGIAAGLLEDRAEC
jgi:hypothetical protein